MHVKKFILQFSHAFWLVLDECTLNISCQLYGFINEPKIKVIKTVHGTKKGMIVIQPIHMNISYNDIISNRW